MTKNLKWLMCVAVIAVFSGVLSAGCSRGPYVPKSDSRAHERANQPVNLLHRSLRTRIGSDASTVDRTEDGRMRVAQSLRNRSNRQLHVQVRCVFKNEDGMSTGDETDWVSMFFDPRQSLTYRAESRTADVESYTVEVRRP